jgi:hypothetical protein
MASAETAKRSRRAGEPSLPRRLWRDYSLSIVVGSMFLASFVLHTIFGWWQYAADQANQGQQATLWGWDGYVIYWGEWTFQNWQSEFLEVLVLIVLTAVLIHKGSHESKDSDEQMQAAIERLERKVDSLSEQSGRPMKKAG